MPDDATLSRLSPGDMVVVLTGSVVRGSGANTIKIHRVGTADLSDNPETRRRLRALVDDQLRIGQWQRVSRREHFMPHAEAVRA